MPSFVRTKDCFHISVAQSSSSQGGLTDQTWQCAQPPLPIRRASCWPRVWADQASTCLQSTDWAHLHLCTAAGDFMPGGAIIEWLINSFVCDARHEEKYCEKSTVNTVRWVFEGEIAILSLAVRDILSENFSNCRTVSLGDKPFYRCSRVRSLNSLLFVVTSM